MLHDNYDPKLANSFLTATSCLRRGSPAWDEREIARARAGCCLLSPVGEAAKQIIRDIHAARLLEQTK